MSTRRFQTARYIADGSGLINGASGADVDENVTSASHRGRLFRVLSMNIVSPARSLSPFYGDCCRVEPRTQRENTLL